MDFNQGLVGEVKSNTSFTTRCRRHQMFVEKMRVTTFDSEGVADIAHWFFINV